MRKKLRRFAELGELHNVFELPTTMAGQWPLVFANNHRLIVELGCGKGEYTVSLAKRLPQNNYIGIDIQGERLWCGAKQATAEQLGNVAWLRAYVDHLEQYFAPGEVAEFWLTFPDPFPTKSYERRRLTAPRFLQMYKKLMTSDGLVHLKTDSSALLQYSISAITASGGSIVTQTLAPALDIETTFERKQRAAGQSVHYICWQWS